MIDVLLKTIPKYLFEPYAVIAVTGLFILLLQRKVKWNYLSLTILGAILFMLGWRLGILIVSSRYAAILIYPVIIFSVYFCFQISSSLAKISHLPEWGRKYLPYALVTLLFCISCIKIFHLNPYRNYLQEISLAVKNDSRKYPDVFLLSETGNTKRYQYYTGIETIPLPELDYPKHIPDPLKLKQTLYHYSFRNGVFYVFIESKSSLGHFSAKDLELTDKEWMLFDEKFQNRHKNRKLLVYKYMPSRKIQFKQKKITSIPQPVGKNFLANGNFEQFHQENAQGLINIKKFFQNNIQGSPIIEGARFPLYWNPTYCPGYLPGHNGKITLMEIDPIDGKYSLSVSSNTLIGFFSEFLTPSSDYLLKFLIKGKKNTSFYWGMHLYNDRKEYQKTRDLNRIRLESNELYEIEITISAAAFHPYPFFTLVFQLEHGELLLDNVSLEKIEVAK